MLRFAVLPVVVIVAFVTACLVPPRPPPGGGDENTCTVDAFTMQRPTDPLTGEPQASTRQDGGVVNRACIGSPAQLSQSTTATVQGCIAVFGTGGAAKPGIKVAFFDDAQDAKNEAPAHGEFTIGTQNEASALDCAGADAATAACMAVTLSCEKKGAYVASDIPLHIPLTMRVYLPGDPTVIDTYTFGIVFDFGQDAPLVDGIVTYEANLIYDSTYESIPTLAGALIDGREQLGDGIGRGVIAGEIHDCDDVIIGGATITSDEADTKTKITYFNGDNDDPLPDLARTSTNNDGLYVILNANTDVGHEVHTVAAGILDPACAGQADCQCVGLSSRTVHVYADSVSIVTLRGDLPVIP